MKVLLYLISLVLVALGAAVTVMSLMTPGDVLLGLTPALGVSVLLGGLIILGLAVIAGQISELNGNTANLLYLLGEREGFGASHGAARMAAPAAADLAGAMAAKTGAEKIPAEKIPPAEEPATGQGTMPQEPAKPAAPVRPEVVSPPALKSGQPHKKAPHAHPKKAPVAEAPLPRPEPPRPAPKVKSASAGMRDAARPPAGPSFKVRGEPAPSTRPVPCTAAKKQERPLKADTPEPKEPPAATAPAVEKAAPALKEEKANQPPKEDAASKENAPPKELPPEPQAKAPSPAAEAGDEPPERQEGRAPVPPLKEDAASRLEALKEASVFKTVKDKPSSQEEEKPPVPPLKEEAGPTPPGRKDEAAKAGSISPEPPVEEEEVLYIIEERVIRGRPARILSDGTIEAEMDEGWLRFENRDHLDEYLDALGDSEA